MNSQFQSVVLSSCRASLTIALKTSCLVKAFFYKSLAALQKGQGFCS